MTTPITGATTTTPDPRTAPDDKATEDAGHTPDNHGVSAQDPAEGTDDDPAPGEGSPEG